MKIEIKQSELYNALDKAVKATDKQYQDVFLKAENDKLVIITNNQEAKIKVIITENIEVKEDGKALLQCKTLYELTKRMNNEYISLEVIDNKLRVKQNRTAYNLALSSEETNKLQDSEYNNSFEVERLDLAKIIETTIVSSSTSNTRAILESLNLSCENSTLTAMATDSFRVSKNTCNLKEEHNFNITIKAKTILDLLKIIEGSSIKVFYTNHKIKFAFKNIEYEARLLEGEYPNIKPFLEEYKPKKYSINKAKLIIALERSSVLLDNLATQLVKLDLKGNLATITAVESELGDLMEVIDIENFSDVGFVCGMNYKYLVDALKTFVAKEVVIEADESLRVIYLTSEKDSVKHAILPMKIH